MGNSNQQSQEVIHNVNYPAADPIARAAYALTGSTAHTGHPSSTRPTANTPGGSVSHDATSSSSDSIRVASGGGRGGCPPISVSAADSGGHSFGGKQFSSSAVIGGVTIAMNYPEPSKEPERRSPALLRVPWWIRVLVALIVGVAAVCLAALIQPMFLALFIPALLLVSERGEM